MLVFMFGTRDKNKYIQDKVKTEPAQVVELSNNREQQFSAVNRVIGYFKLHGNQNVTV